jgi:hypothetical protein
VAEAPDETQALHLTELQRRILEQAFHRYTFDVPEPPARRPALVVKVEPATPGGLYRLGAQGDLPVQLTVSVQALESLSAVRLTYLAQDFYGRKVAGENLPPVFPNREGNAVADLPLKGLATPGYYHVLVTASSEDGTATGACGIVLVQPIEAGPDPKSPFGLAAPPGKVPEVLPETARRLGVCHLAADWADAEAAAEAVRSAGLMLTPILRFSIPQQNPEPAEVAAAAGETILARAKELHDWQIGERPVFTDLSAEAVKSFRQTVSGIIGAARRAKAPASLWPAASPDVLADVLTEGPVLAGADGVALCVDAGDVTPDLRSGAYRRSLDYGIQVGRRMGIKRFVVAETGDDPTIGTPQQQAWKLVVRHVLALAAGAERIYVCAGRGVPVPKPSAAAYATMTHLLDGAKYEGAAWEDVPLVQAHLFAGQDRRVAVVWSWAGEDPAKPDRGALVFERGAGLEALDVVGQNVGIPKGSRLIVPLGEAPIYLVSSELKTSDLRDRLRGARMVGIAPAAVYFDSIVRGEMPGRVNVTLVVQSLRPNRMEGVAGILAPEGWRVRQAKQRFGLDGGQGREVTFECDAPAAGGAGPYPMEAVVSLNEEFVRYKQAVWVAQAPEGVIEVGYGLGAWEGIPPVLLRNAAGDVQAEVRTAWDAKFFYFSAAVQRQRATYRGGRFAFDGDAIQLGWGLADRADDDFGHRGRERALPAGAVRDTDHLMALTFGKDGAQVIRLRGPRIALRARYPGNADPWYGPVAGSTAAIARDDASGRTIYEAAIPMKALAPLGGQRGRVFRFGFRIGDAGRPPLEWARAAGAADFIANPCSFLPTGFTEGLACQTWWGLVGPAAKRR